MGKHETLVVLRTTRGWRTSRRRFGVGAGSVKRTGPMTVSSFLVHRRTISQS